MTQQHSPHTVRILIALTTVLAATAGCGSSDTGPTAITSTTPAPLIPSELSWRSWQGIDLPVAAQGPRVFEGAVASGFDRSPAGAALAAIHATVRMSLAPDSQWAQVGQYMLAPGPGRDRWATARAQISITGPATDTTPTIAGYVLTDYTDITARVDIYSTYPDRSITRNTATVVFSDRWRLQLPDAVAESPVSAVESMPVGMVTLSRS